MEEIIARNPLLVNVEMGLETILWANGNTVLPKRLSASLRAKVLKQKRGRLKGGGIHWKSSKSGGLLVNRHKSLTLAIK